MSNKTKTILMAILAIVLVTAAVIEFKTLYPKILGQTELILRTF